MASLVEQARQQGYRQGLKQGLKQGHYESILRTLQVRFGTVPAALEQSVRIVCDSEVLSDLFVLAIRAPTLQTFEAHLRDWPDGASE